MKIGDLITFFQSLYPEDIQESFDNSGMQICEFEESLQNVMISLDVNDAVIDEAMNKGCNLIITHHPLIFKSLKNITSTSYRGRMLLRLIRNRISIYSMHTNLDKYLWRIPLDILGVKESVPLYPERNKPAIGLGGIGKLEEPMRYEAFLDHVKKIFRSHHLVVAGPKAEEISTVAVINGSGGSMLYELFEKKEADVIITGDVKYHEAFDADLAGVPLIDAGHFHTEKVFLDILGEEVQQFLTKKGEKNAIFIDQVSTSPLRVYI